MRKFMFIIGLLIVFLANGLLPSNVANADVSPNDCGNRSGKYYQANVLARYEVYNRRLVLYNWKTRSTVQIVETNLQDTDYIRWSPDCRFLSGSVGPYSSSDTVIWDLTTNKRVGIFKDARTWPHFLNWFPSPDSRYAVVRTRNGMYLWDILTDARTQLTDQICKGWPQVEWDIQRQEVYVQGGKLTPNACDGVSIHDVVSGRKVAFFGSPISGFDPNFILSSDKHTIILAAARPNNLAFDYVLAIWDRNTGKGMQFETATYQGIFPEPGPDGKPFVTRYTALRIWDLTDPHETLWDRAPKYRINVPRPYKWDLVDYHIIEISSGKEIRRFDLNTGQYLKP